MRLKSCVRRDKLAGAKEKKWENNVGYEKETTHSQYLPSIKEKGTQVFRKIILFGDNEAPKSENSKRIWIKLTGFERNRPCVLCIVES